MEIEKKFNLKFINFNNHTLVSASFNNFHIIPKYLNCTNWKAEFESFEAMLYELNSSQFCIVGDMNAGISEEQLIDQNVLDSIPHINHTSFFLTLIR